MINHFSHVTVCYWTVFRLSDYKKYDLIEYILKQKFLATHHKYAYLLQKSTLKLTQTYNIFGSKCDCNLILYQILPNLICMERIACHQMFSKGQSVNILNFLDVHRRRFQTVSADTHVPETLPRCYTKQVWCMKYHQSWYDLNETLLRWSKI